jgi:hypothetical protein
MGGMNPPSAAVGTPARLPLPWSLCIGLSVLVGAGGAAAQPLAFQELLVDANASGDDKEVADIDGDGDMDGIIAGASLHWYRSNGMARTFGGPFLIRNSIEEFTTDMSVGDIDGDGDVDIVISDGNDANNVRWYENPRIGPPPSGTSDPTVGSNWLQHLIGTHGSWAHDMELGLIDADARLDVITIGNGFFKIHFFNAGDETFSTVDFGAHANDGSPAVADIDGDGDRDIFVKGGWIESPPSNRRVAANWEFHAINNSDPGDGPATVALDIDRDGRIDLVTCPQHVDGDLAWFKNPANPEVAAWPRVLIDDSTGSHHLRAADFDGDGRIDLLAALELSAGYITIWGITGTTPTFTPYPVDSGGGGHNAAVGDLDGNGLTDVWAADWIGNPPLRAYFNGPDVLFMDSFETGNRAKWSSSQS